MPYTFNPFTGNFDYYKLKADADIDHDALLNFVANEHIDHTAVTLTAGVGLSGGGDISANRTFTVDLNELTTETSIASGDFLSMVDITDSGSGKVTFANLESTLAIANMSDESNYALLAGRSGGQTFNFGLDSGDTGTIHTTAHATKAVLNICDTAYVDEVNNLFGVNTPVPESDFQVTGSTLDANIGDVTVTKEAWWLLQFSDVHSSGHAAHTPVFLLRRTRGTKASPTSVANGDQLGAFGFRGYDGTTFEQTVLFAAIVEGAVSNDNVPTRVDISTGFKTNPSLAMRIHSTQLIGMGGVTTALAQVHIDQTSTTGAVPVLYLDQADISEEMIEFNTTIGTGNAIEAVGAKALTTTHFIKVTLPGSLTRYIPCGTIA